MRPDELERRLQERLDALGPAPRAELLHILTAEETGPWRENTTIVRRDEARDAIAQAKKGEGGTLLPSAA